MTRSLPRLMKVRSRRTGRNNTANPSTRVSGRVREIALREAQASQDFIAVIGVVCKTLLDVEGLLETAKNHGEELAKLLERCNMVANAAMMHCCEERAGDHENIMQGLKKLADGAKAIAELCTKGRPFYRRLVLHRKISKDINSLEARITSFAAANDISLLEATDDMSKSIAGHLAGAKLPPGAPRAQTWHVKREKIIAAACDQLGASSNNDSAQSSSCLVGIAGPPGSGKSIAASMIIAREDVRALYSKGVLWLSAGSSAKDRLSLFMYRLADMVYKTVLKSEGRAPRAPDIGVDPEDGAAYVRETIGDDGHQILIVADDVWEAEILETLTSAGTSVLYTTRADYLLGDAPLRFDEIDPHEAETVLRGAAEIGDTLSMAEKAHELEKLCGPSIMDLAFVGRWSVVRRRVDDEAWQTSMGLITDAQKDADGNISLSWRAAVLRAGLGELKRDNENTKVLYLSMAVMPKGFAFALEDAAFLLHGEECSRDNLERVKWNVMALERFAIVARQVGGLYRLHSLHEEFIREEVAKYPVTLEKVQARWQKYVSSVDVLLSWPLDELANVWRAMRKPGEGVDASAYDAAIETMGASDPRLPNALRRVAYLHWLGGTREKACNKWTKLLAIQDNKQLNKEYPDLVLTLYNFGLYQKSVGHIKEAKEWLMRALPVAGEMLGGDHPQVADILHHLAWCSSSMGQTENAEWYFGSALNIREAKLGVNHPDVANTLHGLGLCMLKMRRTQEAEDLLDQALAIYVDHFGVAHSKVGRAVYDLGRCAHMVGRVKDAECLYREAMSTQEKNGEAAGGELADTLHALGGCLSEAERIEEADEFYRRALAIRESILPTDHPDVARVVYSLGKCTYELGRTHEAEGFCRRALVIVKTILGSGHPAVADILHTLGVCAIVDEQVEKGSELLTETLAIYQDQLEPDELKIAHVLYDLGRCASKAGNTKKAEQFYFQALEVEEKHLGPDDPEVATIIYALGGCASKEGREEESEALYRRALTIRAESPGVDYTDVAEALHVLGNCVMLAGRIVEAKVLYSQALDVLEENLPPDHPEINDIKLALGSCETAESVEVTQDNIYFRRG